MKEYSKLIIFAFIGLIFGSLFGYHFKEKLNRRSIQPAIEFAPKKKHTSKNYNPSVLYFFLPESKDVNQATPEALTEFENLLSSPAHRVLISYRKNNSIKNQFQPETGINDAVKLMDKNFLSNRYIPIFTASPLENAECFEEIQFVTLKANHLSSLQELKDKKVAVNNSALRLATLQFKELSEQNITFKELHIFKHSTDLLQELYSKRADALIFKVQKFSNNIIHGILGENTGFEYLDFPDVSVISTSNYQIPCNVLFIKRSLTESLKQELTNKYSDLIYNPSKKKIMKNILGLSSIKNITEDEWSKIVNKLERVYNFKYELVASKVINENKE